MFSKPLAFGILALGCVTAAAGGAYVATRHNAVEVPSAVSAPASPGHQASATAPITTQDKTASSVPATEAPVADPAPAQEPQDSDEPSKAADDTHHTAAERVTAKPRDPKPVAPKAAEIVAKNQPARTVPLPERTTAAPPQPAVPQADIAPPVPAPVMPPPSNDGVRGDGIETPRPAQLEELLLPAASVIGLQVETGLTSERARVEDRVEARVTRDVVVDGRLAIPAGSRMLGSVTQVDRGGKMKERARLAIRFHTLVLANGDEIEVRTEPIVREGEAPAADSSKKIGGAAVGGAILGAILGGGKGAMIGGMAGAGGGTAMVMSADRNPATFQAGAIVTARLSAPASIQVQKEQ